MKIVIIGQFEKSFKKDKISGGIQAAEKLMFETLSEKYKETYLITSNDSNVNNFFNEYNVIKLDLCCQENFDENLDRIQKGFYNKQRSKQVVDIIRKIDPDVIINHSFSSSTLTQLRNICSDYFIMNIIHNTADTSADMSIFNKNKRYIYLDDNGSKTLGVSRYQLDTLINFISLYSKKFEYKDENHIKRVYKDYINVSYMQKNDELFEYDKDEYSICISRPEKAKQLENVLRNIKKTNIKLKLFLSYHKPLEECSYFLSIKKHLTDNVQIFFNASRNELLSTLSKAKYNIVSSKVESFGIVALEAAYYGVPTISFTKDNELHGTKDIMGKYFLPTNGKDLPEKINKNYDLQHKMNLHLDVLSRYNKEMYLQNIEKHFKPKIRKNYLSY